MKIENVKQDEMKMFQVMVGTVIGGRLIEHVHGDRNDDGTFSVELQTVEKSPVDSYALADGRTCYQQLYRTLDNLDAYVPKHGPTLRQACATAELVG